MPTASPLTMHTPCLLKSRQSDFVAAMPATVALREPTTVMHLPSAARKSP